jgi:hypothetical protein
MDHTVIRNNQDHVLHYGDKIHITFADDLAEIEIHYNAV